MHTIGNIKKSLNPELEVLGILFTMYSKRTRLSRDVVDDIVSYFDDLVFDTMILGISAWPRPPAMVYR